MRKQLFFWMVLSILMCPAFADDAVEAVAPGDIVFEKTPNIIMQDETLTITKLSKDFQGRDFSIDVVFHFKNISNQDMTRNVAFALPPVICNDESHSTWEGLNNGNANDANQKGLKDFTAFANKEKINYTLRFTAELEKHNITTLLEELHIPLNPCQIKLTKEGKLDPQYAKALTDNHLITTNNLPAWSENIYFEWKQVFPAGKVIEITHHYTPVIGTSVPSPLSEKEINRYYTDSTQSYTPLWNRDPSTLVKSNPELIYKTPITYVNPPADIEGPRYCVIPSWVLYRLTTGAYWNGGIGTFHLLINDQAQGPFAVNKFYSSTDTVQTKIANDQMSFTLDHFTPTQDLMVLFLSLPQSKDDLKLCGIK